MVEKVQYYVGLEAFLDGSWWKYQKPVVYKCSNYQTWNAQKFQRCLILFKNGCKKVNVKARNNTEENKLCVILTEWVLQVHY